MGLLHTRGLHNCYEGESLLVIKLSWAAALRCGLSQCVCELQRWLIWLSVSIGVPIGWDLLS